MLPELGASLKPLHLTTWFPHPLNTDEKAYALLDVCHMLKPTLADGGMLKDKQGNNIPWQYFVELHKLQTT